MHQEERQQNRSRQDSQSSGRPHSAGRGGPSPHQQPLGFHRGGRGGSAGPRGGGGGHAPGGAPGGPQQGFRGRGAHTRGGFQPGRPQQLKKETLKFEQDYDFEQANEQFQEVLNKLAGTKLEDGASTSKSEVGQENGDAVVEDQAEEEEVYYDKQKSFFDSISCEALERSKGKMVR